MQPQILTKTEDQVIRLKLQGFSRKEIAALTFRSTGTIQRHFQNVYEKLNIQNEIELYNWYAENILDINFRQLLKPEGFMTEESNYKSISTDGKSVG